jgi:cobalamin-dependent methionine synthase I
MVSPLFYGTGDMLTWDPRALLNAVDRTWLYRNYWCRRALGDIEFERQVLTDFEPAFEALKGTILEYSLLDARGYYGIWPACGKEETLCLLDPSDFATEIGQFTFPRVGTNSGRSIADWLRPEGDVIALQAVTIGPELARQRREYLDKGDKHGLGTYLDGLGRLLAELLADRVTGEVRRAMHVADCTQGTRYTFGNPGLPGLEEQRALLDLICAEDRLGLSLTQASQIVPEYSAVGVFVHHKDSRPL